MIPDFIEIYDNSISREECLKVIEIFEEFDSVGMTNPGTFSNPNKDLDFDTSIKHSTDITITCESYFSNYLVKEVSDIIFGGLEDGIKKYTKKYPNLNSMSKWSLEDKWNIQRYNDGEGYHQKHCEHGPFNPFRILTWILYLNDSPCGTELLSYDKIISAKAGRLLIFPAGFTHYHKGVSPNIGTKYIATGWHSFLNDGKNPIIL